MYGRTELREGAVKTHYHINIIAQACLVEAGRFNVSRADRPPRAQRRPQRHASAHSRVALASTLRLGRWGQTAEPFPSENGRV